MNAYTLALHVIRNCRCDYNATMQKLDLLLWANRITNEQYKELSEMLIKPEVSEESVEESAEVIDVPALQAENEDMRGALEILGITDEEAEETEKAEESEVIDYE